jgi:hypothetical protein
LGAQNKTNNKTMAPINPEDKPEEVTDERIDLRDVSPSTSDFLNDLHLQAERSVASKPISGKRAKSEKSIKGSSFGIFFDDTPEFDVLKQDEKMLAKRMMIDALSTIGGYHSESPEDRVAYDEDINYLSESDLCDMARNLPGRENNKDLYEDSTIKYVAGQVMTAMKRIIDQKERNI